MVKTQIQLPDELYRKVKEFADQREWSLAEVFRRGAEDLLQRYPSNPAPRKKWSLPKPRDLGWLADFSDEEIKKIAQEEELNRALPRQ